MVLCWIDHVWSSKECVCCACDPNERVYVGGYGGLSESGLCVFCKLCPVCFLVVGNGPSVLLSVVMSYVNCGNYG